MLLINHKSKSLCLMQSLVLDQIQELIDDW